MFDLHLLQVFALSALVMAMILTRYFQMRDAEDAETRAILHSRPYRLVNGEWIVFQENGQPLMNLSAYFDDLPVTHCMGVLNA